MKKKNPEKRKKKDGTKNGKRNLFLSLKKGEKKTKKERQ